MKVLTKGITLNGVAIQIEEWSEDYSFMPYGNTIAAYPKSKTSHEGSYSPKANEKYRFAFNFNSYEETQNAYKALVNGNKDISDYKSFLSEKRYQDCI